ncbi:PHD and RING finger domain-containing protein 1 [Nymphon striatum]|nr:PHD and RING finger domain-containing protein 1 [Nymphon striatum]
MIFVPLLGHIRWSTILSEGSSVDIKMLDEKVLTWITGNFGEHYIFTPRCSIPHIEFHQKWCKDHFSGFWDKNMWPSTSSDISPMDFAIWSILKSDILAKSYSNVTALKEALLASWTTFDEVIQTDSVESLGLPPASESGLHLLTVCEVCGQGDREDQLLLCDGCDRGYHCDCLSPALNEVPIEEWFCPDCAGQFIQEVSVIEGSGSSNHRLGSSMEPVIRRVIARTRASESVIRRVNYNRNERNVANSTTSFTSKKRRKRKTVKRKSRKLTKKGTGKSVRKTKSGARKKTRRRRKRRRRPTSLKKSSKYVKIPSVRKRIAEKLGIQKSKGPAHALPKIKKTCNRDQFSESLLSVHSDQNYFTGFSDHERESLEIEELNDSENVSGNTLSIMASARSRTSVLRTMVKKGLVNFDGPSTSGVSMIKKNIFCHFKTITTVDTDTIATIDTIDTGRNPIIFMERFDRMDFGANNGSVDILGSILKDQSLLHSKSKDIMVTPEGSLKSKVSSEAQVKFPASFQCHTKQNAAPVSEKSGSNSVSSSQPAASNSGSVVTTVHNTIISSNSNQALQSNFSATASTSQESDDSIDFQDNLPDSTVNISKKKYNKNVDEEVNLYSDIEDEMIEDEIPNYQHEFQASEKQDRNEYCDVEPSYSPIVDTDISDDDLIIDESKEVVANEENKSGEMLSSKSTNKDDTNSENKEGEQNIVCDNSDIVTHEKTNNDEKLTPIIACEDSLELEGISETDEPIYQSDSDSIPITVPTDMDFQLCKDNVFESPNNENSNAEIRDIQDMLSPVSAAGSSKDSNNDCSQEEEDLIIREKIHPDKSSYVKSFEENSNNVNWKKLSQSSKVRSYRDGKPKDKQTYFQDREIKRKRRNRDHHNTNEMPVSNKYSAQSASVMRDHCDRHLENIENRQRKSRREKSRYQHDRYERSRSKDDKVGRYSKLRMDEITQERCSSSSDNRKHRHRRKHLHHAEKAFQDSSNKTQEKRKRKRQHSHSDEERSLRRKRSTHVSHSTKNSNSETSKKKSRRAAQEKEVTASGNNITVKVNFDNNECSEEKNEEVNKNVSYVRKSVAISKKSIIQLNDDEIIILSSPSSSNCSIYTVEDSEPETVEPTALDIDENSIDEVDSSSSVQTVDGRTEVRKVVMEENVDESNSGPSSLKIVVSCDSVEEKQDKDVPILEKEAPLVLEKHTEDNSMVEVYDPFEPTNSPSPEHIEEVKQAPPLPELPPLPPEPPEESVTEPALPSFHEKAEELPPMIQVPNCQTNWQIPGPLSGGPMPHQMHPPSGTSNIMMQPMTTSMFSRPPPTHMSTPIRIIPPTVLPSTSVPPPPLIRKLPHRLNVPPPNITQNIPLNSPPNFNISAVSNNVPPFQNPSKDQYQIAEDVTDVVDMEVDNSPCSNEDNSLPKSPAKPLTQPSKSVLKTKMPRLKITNDLKIDSIILSLVTNKQILHTLANKGVSNHNNLKQKTHFRNPDLFSDKSKSATTEKRKHTLSKSPRKTGPRTPESDTNDHLFDELVHRSRVTNDKKKYKPGKQFSFSGGAPAIHLSDDHKKGINVKIGEDKLHIIDDLPNSAVEMQVKEKFLKKLNRQERVVEEVKLALKPYYHKRDISKDDYKEIMRKAVPKICHNKSGEINPVRIKSLIEGYAKRCRHQRKKRSTLPSSTT